MSQLVFEGVFDRLDSEALVGSIRLRRFGILATIIHHSKGDDSESQIKKHSVTVGWENGAHEIKNER